MSNAGTLHLPLTPRILWGQHYTAPESSNRALVKMNKARPEFLPRINVSSVEVRSSSAPQTCAHLRTCLANRTAHPQVHTCTRAHGLSLPVSSWSLRRGCHPLQVAVLSMLPPMCLCLPVFLSLCLDSLPLCLVQHIGYVHYSEHGGRSNKGGSSRRAVRFALPKSLRLGLFCCLLPCRACACCPPVSFWRWVSAGPCCRT